MPDLVMLFERRWKLVLSLTLLATLVAFVACLLLPKQYRGTATALPSNSLVGDKARLFNQSIEALYPEIGAADELDKMEGTAKLDTIFLAAATALQLPLHYGLDSSKADALDQAALRLRRNTNIAKTGYGELQVSVWDKDKSTAAALANYLMQTLNNVHRHLQMENSQRILRELKTAYSEKRGMVKDSLMDLPGIGNGDSETDHLLSSAQLKQYQQLISEYELALKTTPDALLIVERARPQPWPDKPRTGTLVLFAFLGSLLFSFLLAVYLESRSR